MSIGYRNISGIAGWNRGQHLSAQHKANISKGNKGKRAGKTWEQIYGVEKAAEMRAKSVARKRTPEQREKTSKSLKRAYAEGRKAKPTFAGPTHPMWRGGAKDYRLMRPEWKVRRKEIYARDKWTCQHCGKHCAHLDIQCHHIIAYVLSHDDSPENLITLCRACHCAIERPRDPRPRVGTALGMLV